MTDDLPLYEQGEGGLLDVLGIDGECCVSCAQDADDGYGDLPSVLLPDGSEVAVCCAHVEAVREALRETLVADRA